MDHPAVAMAVAFAIPDARLGEEIGAVVVLRPGTEVSELALMKFALERISDFKVPRRIVFADEIPKGPTGKVQRIGLARQLGIESLTAKIVSPGSAERRLNPTETELANIWCEVLNVTDVKADDDFQLLGGDSITAARVISRVEARMKRTLPIVAFFMSPTLASVAAAIEPHAQFQGQ
jgi:acyl carrier protein